MWDMDFLVEEEILCSSAGWTLEQNKLFENALAFYDQDTPDRWEKVASKLPGKSAFDVEQHYMDLVEDVQVIEAGLIAPPSYSNSSCSMEWMAEKAGGLRGLKQCGGGAKGQSGKSSDQERKKGVPWTEEEHRLFLLGLHKYGKGDWRSISRNYVVSRTPTQVASHAQKYFIRLHSGNKDKRRSSIHDITTINGLDRRSFSLQNAAGLSRQANSSSIPIDYNQSFFYPTLARNSFMNSTESQAEYNHLMMPHYSLGLYPQRGMSNHTSRAINPDSPLSMSQLGYASQPAMQY